MKESYKPDPGEDLGESVATLELEEKPELDRGDLSGELSTGVFLPCSDGDSEFGES